MTYFLQYRQGITPKVTKAAFSIGSAVHWGLEHNTEDLVPYYEEQGTKITDTYTDEQVLAEGMVHGFLINKEHIFDEILRHPLTGEKLTLVKESHELWITGNLKSFILKHAHEFVGIIDLLLLVQDRQGQLYFIIIDYKTSSFIPNWDDYLDQIYRYIFLLNSYVPEVPVLKTGIINLRKTKVKRKSNESPVQFSQRIKREYEIDDGEYLCWHMFDTDTLDKKNVDAYLDNLSRQADTAELIDSNNAWFINYGNAVTKYGKSPYYDIFYHTPHAEVMYNITDHIYNEETGEFDNIRDCRELDMKVIDHTNVLNKYEQFKIQALAFYSVNQDIDKDKLFDDLRSRYLTDDYLLEKYWNTLIYEVKHETDA